MNELIRNIIENVTVTSFIDSEFKEILLDRLLELERLIDAQQPALPLEEKEK